jgi:hypothetical protein
MKALFEKHIKHPDLTRTASASRSVGAKLQGLIQDCAPYDLNRLKKEFMKIIDSPDTVISKAKAQQYRDNINKIYTVERLRVYITNIYCDASNNSLKLR